MWTLGTVKIAVQEMPDNTIQVLPRLQPINAGTTIQVFGYENTVYKLTGLVVGQTDCGTLRGYAQDFQTHTLVSPYSDYTFNTALYVKSVTINPTKISQQYIRTDLPCATPVFNVELELYLP